MFSCLSESFKALQFAVVTLKQSMASSFGFDAIGLGLGLTPGRTKLKRTQKKSRVSDSIYKETLINASIYNKGFEELYSDCLERYSTYLEKTGNHVLRLDNKENRELVKYFVDNPEAPVYSNKSYIFREVVKAYKRNVEKRLQEVV